MKTENKEKFEALLNTLCKTYHHRRDEQLFKVWWFSLKQFEYEAIAKAIGKWIGSSSIFPRPFDIVSILRQNLAYDQKQLPHHYKPVTLEKAADNIKKIREKFGWKTR